MERTRRCDDDVNGSRARGFAGVARGRSRARGKGASSAGSARVTLGGSLGIRDRARASDDGERALNRGAKDGICFVVYRFRVHGRSSSIPLVTVDEDARVATALGSPRRASLIGVCVGPSARACGVRGERCAAGYFLTLSRRRSGV